MEPRPGTLLVSSPELLDPNFADAVILLIDADDNGALGVVLNQPTPVLVADVLESWRDLVDAPEVLHKGGPVATDGALAVARLRDPGDEPVGFQRCFADIGLVDLDSPTELLEGGISSMRIFAGYAGWGAEQLEAEIEEGSWYVVPAEAGDIFREDATTLRRDVLRRQPGDLAWASTRPVDPMLN
ncbi:putative transcriptional regulator [Nocardioides daedukensis]|uniref:Putative transcriptional regulator n=1 Tax=Nocardioides daedukensis TaxID=634462 RepID=A0A7Y9UNB4_9ACTN|nr:YqgE/AlgH family protein [Nocardioides daedukensis]NYG58378.1 putative transcriptional regulator [Nocardioides daedukensis]